MGGRAISGYGGPAGCSSLFTRHGGNAVPLLARRVLVIDGPPPRASPAAGTTRGGLPRPRPPPVPPPRIDPERPPAPGVEHAPRRAFERTRDVAGDRGQRLVQGVELRQGVQQPAGVGMGGGVQHLAHRAGLDDPPEVHHRDPVGGLRDHPRSWVMNRMAIPSSATSSCIRSRTWAWMVTSSAVVGSSAMRSRAGWRAPSRSSRAGASRLRARRRTGRSAGPRRRSLPVRASPPSGRAPRAS